jgi:hypothetical protein
MISQPTDPRPQRALRLATGVAVATGVAYGLEFPVPFIAPVLALFLLATRVQPLPLNAIVGLPVLATLTTSTGLLLIPVLQYAAVSGVLLVGLAMFLCFRYLLSGGNALPAMFLVIGLTLISAAGTTSFAIAATVIEALAKGLLLAGLTVGVSHRSFPEPADARAAPPAPAIPDIDVARIAPRATLVVLPSFLLALTNPATYMPLIMKSVALGQQARATSARDAAREILGATLLGGLLAVAFWGGLKIFPHLWMFFLWTLLISLLFARKLYALRPTRLSPGLWLNALTTMFILLGQSVQNAAAGKDVYTAFLVRMSLFVAVTLYACAMIYLIDTRREVRRATV